MSGLRRNFIDTGVWLTLFEKDEGWQKCLSALEEKVETYTSLLTLYEVLLWYQHRKPKEVAYVAGQMKNRARLIGIDESIVFDALRLKQRHPQFSTVDAMSLATARKLQAIFVTADSDFKGIPHARVLKVT